MESVKDHFMVTHTEGKKLRCWKCDKEVKTISELKQHIGSYHYTPIEDTNKN